MGKYVYKDTVFYLRKFEYNNYRVEYELFEKDGTWNASVLCF